MATQTLTAEALARYAERAARTPAPATLARCEELAREAAVKRACEAKALEAGQDRLAAAYAQQAEDRERECRLLYEGW